MCIAPHHLVHPWVIGYRSTVVLRQLGPTSISTWAGQVGIRSLNRQWGQPLEGGVTRTGEPDPGCRPRGLALDLKMTAR